MAVVRIAIVLSRVPGVGQISRFVKAGNELFGCILGEAFGPGEGVGGFGG